MNAREKKRQPEDGSMKRFFRNIGRFFSCAARGTAGAFRRAAGAVRSGGIRIRGKLFLVILLILVFNLLVTFLFAQTLIGRLYTFSKTRELLSYQSRIRQSYTQDQAGLSGLIDEAEQKNITVLVFSMDGTSADIEYFSRNTALPQSPDNPARGRYDPLPWIRFAYENGYLTRLEGGSGTITLATRSLFRAAPSPDIMAINVFSALGSGHYLFLETPTAQIEHTAALGIRYMLFISLGTLAIALAVLAVVSRKITAPIIKAQQVANKIANLDFSEKCSTESGDELGDMGRSINRMAETLRENIHRLTYMNAVLREDLEREENTNRIRREFVANVSHDFKTPLSLIAAYGESIRDSLGEGADPAGLKEQCDIIIAESRKMDGMVNRLLRLSQLESGTVMLNRSMFDLNGLIGDVIQSGKILLKERGLTVAFEPGEEHIAYADHAKIGQVLQNLFENAAKYALPGSAIRITAEGETDFRVTVFNRIDTRPAEDPNDFFLSFYKGDTSRSLEDKSYGLGLAIVKAIVELHGSECGAYYTEDGIAFWFEVSSFVQPA